jgi:hypothetical protein
MNDARTTRKTASPGSRRAQRGAAAVVAQYIHELSVRHANSRRGTGADPGQARPRSRPDRIREEATAAIAARTP